MSAKWIRSKQWDDRNIPPWAWPIKAILRAFSSITMAVVLLSLVSLYCALASVPIGLMVLGLSYLVYGLTLVATIMVIGGVPIGVWRLVWRPRSPGARAARFAGTVLGGIVLAVLAAGLWHRFAWPHLQYDPAYGTGLRLFSDFVSTYEATTIRRMPWIEMSELEFYAWWPLQLILALFMLNMIVATVRRIEFSFPNIGVLTVHSGIVVIALGSMYYGALKQEGDTLLWAGEPSADGRPTIGAPQAGFYDNTRSVLWARQDGRLWEQRPIRVPRYNEYNLGAGFEERALVRIGREVPSTGDHGRVLDRPVPPPRDESLIDPDIEFRIVGYASYAEAVNDFARAEPAPGEQVRPMRFLELFTYHDHQGRPSERPLRYPFYFLPGEPVHRLAETEVFGLEYVRELSPERLQDLTVTLPDGTRHALVVEIPADEEREAFHGVFAARAGEDIEVGETGYTLRVEELLPEPPFPIITEGYRNAKSSVAVVQITSPDGSSFERWLYHRYPEISQDMLPEMTTDGRQMRRAADSSIRLSYIDASKLQIYVDEPGEGKSARVIIRERGSPTARVVDGMTSGDTLKDVIQGLHLRFGERWAHAVEFEWPRIVPAQVRQNDEIGNHMNAMLAVEVSTDAWSRIIWLPFTKYLGVGMGTEREMTLPDGRRLHLAFGRLRYPLPGFMVQLVDFQMVAYDHRGAPRDYQSLVRVVPRQFSDVPTVPMQRLVEMFSGPFETFEHITKLNAPLQAPFIWSDERSRFGNVAGLLLSRLNPQQFKFSQAGWDAAGWEATQERVDRGELRRPYAQFTILGVGNNPGIHIIALGSILMSIGIPWAFYIKPLIMQRRKRRIQQQIKAGTYRKAAVERTAPAAELATAGVDR